VPKKNFSQFNPKKEVSVMAWIEDDEGSILLVRQAAGRRLWTLPGGKVKRSESLQQALKRETREETGLSVRADGLLYFYDRPKRGAITVLFKVSVKRRGVRMHFPDREIADLGFYDHLPVKATPSAKYFWKRHRMFRDLEAGAGDHIGREDFEHTTKKPKAPD
jgi:ADP-ribose pyrophosphatase YjhB (NUDIX family)